MSDKRKNLSDIKSKSYPKAAEYKIGILTAEWNEGVTIAMRDAAIDTLQKNGVSKSHMYIRMVPGSFELVAGARMMIQSADVDAVIVLGSVIQGETRHFDFICEAVTQGITKLNIETEVPVIFGVLTTNTMEQAIARAGGAHGNKGDEAAVAALDMLVLRDDLQNS